LSFPWLPAPDGHYVLRRNSGTCDFVSHLMEPRNLHFSYQQVPKHSHLIYLASVYVKEYKYPVAIVSFSDPATEILFIYGKTRKGLSWSALARIVRRKLDMIHFAARLNDLKSPPGNRLEALSGKLKGWHSIRVNDQWRILFIWSKEGAKEVRVDDYH
jgi:proteic killer suppression protein